MSRASKNPTAKKGPRPRKRGTSRPHRITFVTVSLAVVAIALAAVLGGLYLRGSAPAAGVGRAVSDGAASAAGQDGGPATTGATGSSTTGLAIDTPTAEGAPTPVTSAASPRVASSGTAASETGVAGVPPGPLHPAGARVPAKAVGTDTGRHPASYRISPNRNVPTLKARTIVFVIDDAGYSMKQLEAFLRLPFPLTIAVLPDLPNSATAARAVRAAGKELILHQPMQALGGQNPGPGAILLGMRRAEIESIVDANLKTVPGAIGMNNHMGSAATTDLGIMEAVAAIAKRRGIYYVDSLTTSGTAVAEAARREGIPYWERNVFLDNSPDRVSIIRAVEDGKKRASSDRPAVMIGHVWSAELAQTLTDLYPQLVAEGFSLSTISRLMVQEAEEDDASPGY